ncbi:MAG: efflux RND transporter periplasmic adaptor subunit, partial [Mariprofundaceae bacterium]
MNKNIIITAIVTLIIGVSAGYFLAPAGKTGSETGTEKIASKERKPLFYRNPMNPLITSPVPAKDEMGMKYIPVYADSETSSGMTAGTVSIDPVTTQNIGVRTATVKRTTLSRVIRSVGRVTFDEQRVARFHSKIDGWIEELFIEKTGDRVKKDTMLLSIYSPQLVASEEEYILALTNADTLKESPFKDIRNSAESLVRSSRERLELLDVPAHQLREIERTRKVIKRLHIHSPFDGTVMKIGAREGQRVTPETELYMIADLTRLWVIVDLYEDDMPWVKEGDMAEMRVSGIPGETFKGKVSYIYPYLEAKTRTVKVRLEVDNSDLRLKPEMFANVTLMSNRQLNAITVPSEAIVRTGAREQLFIERAAGKFEPRDVVIGVSADGETQILEGLRVGEKVVTSSQFLIDSESKLKEATSKMLETLQPETDAKPAQMDHGDMQMDHGDMQMDHGDMQMDHG